MLFDLLVFKLELILNVYAWQHVTVINLYLIIYLIHEAFLTGMAAIKEVVSGHKTGPTWCLEFFF